MHTWKFLAVLRSLTQINKNIMLAYHFLRFTTTSKRISQHRSVCRILFPPPFDSMPHWFLLLWDSHHRKAAMRTPPVSPSVPSQSTLLCSDLNTRKLRRRCVTFPENPEQMLIPYEKGKWQLEQKGSVYCNSANWQHPKMKRATGKVLSRDLFCVLSVCAVKNAVSPNYPNSCIITKRVNMAL